LILKQPLRKIFPAIPFTTTYDATLMPGFDPGLFEAPHDLVAHQLPVWDVDGSIVRPWNIRHVLVEGALVVCCVTMVAWIITDRAVRILVLRYYTNC
jgi:hypothetical protein